MHSNLKKKSCKKEVRKNFFLSRVIPSRNAVPETVVTAPTLNTFKNQIDKFIGEKQYTVFPDIFWVYSREGG